MGTSLPAGAAERGQQPAGHRRTWSGRESFAELRLRFGCLACSAERPAAGRKPGATGEPDPGVRPDPGTGGRQQGMAALRFHGPASAAIAGEAVLSLLSPA